MTTACAAHAARTSSGGGSSSVSASQVILNQSDYQTGAHAHTSSITVQGQLEVTSEPDTSFGGAFTTYSRFRLLPSGSNLSSGVLYYFPGDGTAAKFGLGVSGYNQMVFDGSASAFQSTWYLTGGNSGLFLRCSDILDLCTFGSSVTIEQRLVVSSTLTYGGYEFAVTAPAPNNVWAFDGTRWKPTATYTTYYAYKEFGEPSNVSTNTAFYTAYTTSPFYGTISYEASVSTSSNYAEWTTIVPTYFSTSTEITTTIKIRLGAADTGSHKFILEMADLSDSASFDSPTYTLPITMTITADGSGAVGDQETGTATLTGWAAALTAGHGWRIRIKRDPTETSTVRTYLWLFMLDYGKTRP